MKTSDIRSRYDTFTLRLCAVFIFIVMAFNTFAQISDSIPKREKILKNSFKFNLTSKLLYPNSYLFSYERVVGKNQSVNVFGGYQEFPLSLNLHLSDTRLTKSKTKSGYSIGIDYRFYLPKENRNNAPDGVYLAPYVSVYHFQFERELEHTYDGINYSANLNSKINVLLIGGQLGYQFVLWKRLVIDAVVFGPALSHYDFNARLSEELSGLKPDEALQAVIDALKEKFPLLNDLTSNQGINKSGREAFWSLGFRYSISVGFRF